jgi:hypothetical protein
MDDWDREHRGKALAACICAVCALIFPGWLFVIPVLVLVCFIVVQVTTSRSDSKTFQGSIHPSAGHAPAPCRTPLDSDKIPTENWDATQPNFYQVCAECKSPKGACSC